MDQLPVVTEWSRLDEMIRDVHGTLADRPRIEPLDRVGDSSVQLLLTRGRDGSE